MGNPICNVTDFGARGDGQTLDSDAINAAIEAVSLKGGGTVWIPAGVYACYSIRLRSHLTLHLEPGATLLAATPTHERGYDIASDNPSFSVQGYQDAGHSFWEDSLLWGIGLENLTMEGAGLIDGKGLDKWDTGIPGRGNKAIALKACRNVVIRDLRIYRGGHFCILPTGVENFTIDNVQIDSNRDGINIDCCRNVRLSNCVVNTPNDDAIVLKSSMALGFVKDTENVTITNCQVMGYDLGTFFDGTYGTQQVTAPDFGGVTGRIKLGTESSGGFKNITISNCTFERSRGLALETVDGGDLEDITVSNLTMREVVNAPLFLRRGARMRGPGGRPVGQFRRVSIENVVVHFADRKYACMVMGIPGYPVEQVSLRNLYLNMEGGADAAAAGVEVPELEEGYPDPQFFGQIPAHGLFLRHASDLSLSGITVRCMEPDARPCVVLDSVCKLRMRDLDLPSGTAGTCVRTRNCAGLDAPELHLDSGPHPLH